MILYIDGDGPRSLRRGVAESGNLLEPAALPAAAGERHARARLGA